MDSGTTRGWTGHIDWPPAPPTERGKHRKTPTSFDAWTPVPRDEADNRRDEDPFKDTDQFAQDIWDTDPIWDTEPVFQTSPLRPVTAPHEPGRDRTDQLAPLDDTADFDDLVLHDLDVLEPTGGLAPVQYLTSDRRDTSPLDTAAVVGSRADTSGDDSSSRRSGVWLLAGSSVIALCYLLATPETLFNQPRPERDMPLPAVPEERAEGRPPAAQPPSMPEITEPSPRALPTSPEPTRDAPEAEPPAHHSNPAEPPPRSARPTEPHPRPLLTEVGGVTARSLWMLSETLDPDEPHGRDADAPAPRLVEVVPPVANALTPAHPGFTPAPPEVHAGGSGR